MSLTPALKTHFLNLYHMALTDSQVDIRELETIYRIGEARGVGRSDIDALLLQPDSASFSVPETVLEKVDCLYDLCLIAWADGVLDEDERQTLELYCSRFGFRDENIASICEFLLDEAFKNTPKQQVLSTVSQNL
ncbi:TerB family tellurite resistance protein [Chitinophaga filiformis]|uniref:tellurite resistance TerB family protein n=1 Tax=Chitinophaga filiformis TaxID=104663 RepID=UPI001F340581|nr:TerB family tellurite resistance protein [Chitinophaga filiformis]MCF6406761.1 TerB family tellurite resistance protein [Chitinophaga filiformis]